MEKTRGISVRSRNLRLTAIRSFFQFTALEAPAQYAQIQRALAIPGKRYTRTLINFLTRLEMNALLGAPDQKTWFGRHDHAWLLVAMQTGLRWSGLTGLKRQDLTLETGPHIRVVGKGRKERCVPLTKQTVSVLKAWLREPARGQTEIVFPNARGGNLSADGAQYLLAKHAAVASQICPSLQQKRVTPHVLRNTIAMELLQAGVDWALVALWLGHESVETTQIYLEANLDMREEILAKTTPPEGKPGRYQADDQLLAFLKGL
jgi:site-specific recombinase XerD